MWSWGHGVMLSLAVHTELSVLNRPITRVCQWAPPGAVRPPGRWLLREWDDRTVKAAADMAADEGSLTWHRRRLSRRLRAGREAGGPRQPRRPRKAKKGRKATRGGTTTTGRQREPMACGGGAYIRSGSQWHAGGGAYIFAAGADSMRGWSIRRS
eukprot:1196249-Prorocentrum_minimum.AAC.2